MKQKIPTIIDCDNTLGIAGCDIDDGMALLYLLGCPEVELLGITCSYGNSTQEKVYPNVKRLLKKWRCEDIPVFQGSFSPEDKVSPAAEFLAEMSEKYKGQLRVLCLGSTTNLAGAGQLNPDFYKNVKEFSFMGGLTAPLFVGDKPMAELNFSIDWASSLEVFRNASKIKIATAQNCLQSYFTEADFHKRTAANPGPVADFLEEETQYWFDFNRTDWNIDGIVNWDVMAAAQLIHPEFFDMNDTFITPDEESMKTGFLIGNGPEIKVSLPVIKDQAAYLDHIYQTYFNAELGGVK